MHIIIIIINYYYYYYYNYYYYYYYYYYLFFLPLLLLVQTEDFEPYFAGRKRLLPRPSDLSFYNWETQTATSNPTPNYQVNIWEDCY